MGQSRVARVITRERVQQTGSTKKKEVNIMAESKNPEVVELSSEALDEVSGGRWRPKGWVKVYEVVRQSDPPIIVATFDTREKAEAYAKDWSFHRVEEREVLR